ncbi:MAG: dipeptide epimerase [Ktedonobacteraceae bacterium]
MYMNAHAIDLKLTTPFRISRGVQETSPNIIVEIGHQEYKGYGEASPTEYYGETPASVLACIALFKNDLGDDPFALEDILQRLDSTIGLNPAAKAAIDMALYDLIGKMLGVPLYKLLGLNSTKTPLTSFTIGIDSPAQMAKKAALAKEYPILKVKLGTKHDIEIIKAIREVSNATIRVDANSAWTPKEAIKTINALAPYTIEFIEQPVPSHNLEGLKLIHNNVPVPILADESSVTVEDIPQLVGCVDGINIKLMKCGGIRHALKMIHVARAHHLSIMLGCMIESSLAITAAAHLTPLVDYADLDGNLLIENDPYEGVKVEDAKLLLPDEPGLGVKVR